MTKNTPLLRKRQPKSSPLLGRKQPKSPPLRRRKQPQPRRNQPQATQSLHYLPLDLVEEILCRLPVKQLLQLRCVCKSWNSLISENSDFAKKHLRASNSNEGRHHLILKSSRFRHFESPVSTVCSSRDTTMSMYSLREILKKGESDVDGGGHVSTCDGILCYSIDGSSAILFNPSIRKFIISPPLKFPDQSHVSILFTLVYDRFINNYKIIALIGLITQRQVHVHTLGTHSWRRIQDFPSRDQLERNSNFKLNRTSTGIFMNDSVNWLTWEVIVSLDLKTESYQKLSLPVPVSVCNKYFIFATLGTLKGCLSLLISMMDKFSEVWIMKEFGNEKSWTKLLSIPYMKTWGRFRYSKVLYISDDRRVLMEILMTRKYKYRLVVYDSINNTFHFPEFQNKIHDAVVPKVYVESLISPFSRCCN
ncbi:unnamed protein product [Lathyrus sativus]|nr:unnamed protein product [Lathyrus sativus]